MSLYRDVSLRAIGLDREVGRRGGRRLVAATFGVAAGLALASADGHAQARAAATARATAAGTASAARAAVPFGPGERARYEVRLGPAVVGRGSIEIPHTELVRGRPAYRTAFRVRGGVPFYRVDDRMESWIDVETLSTVRAVQSTREGRRTRHRQYEIYPERGVYTEAHGAEGAAPPAAPESTSAPAADDGAAAPALHPTVTRPFDEGAFVQFVRTVPLDVGQRYVFDRYYKPDRNPVTVDVLRRERVTVPAGTFDAVVIRPSFRTKGIFAQSGGTEVWLSDDARRVVLRIRTHLPFGSLTLALTEYTPPDTTLASARPVTAPAP
ncbi:MAG TPA: DUF3108 domain-containing protein [Gemmatirosa sp.]|nr:DUF3108 domain-containing protein [Gemmatirosa sp.]